MVFEAGISSRSRARFTWVVETPSCEKVWIWERIHRPQSQDLLQQLNALKGDGESP